MHVYKFNLNCIILIFKNKFNPHFHIFLFYLFFGSFFNFILNWTNYSTALLIGSKSILKGALILYLILVFLRTPKSQSNERFNYTFALFIIANPWFQCSNNNNNNLFLVKKIIYSNLIFDILIIIIKSLYQFYLTKTFTFPFWTQVIKKLIRSYSRHVMI